MKDQASQGGQLVQDNSSTPDELIDSSVQQPTEAAAVAAADYATATTPEDSALFTSPRRGAGDSRRNRDEDDASVNHGQLKPEKPKKEKKPRQPWSKRKKIIVAIVVILVLAGIGAGVYFLLLPQSISSTNDYEINSEPVRYYSVLTGEEISSSSLNSSPTYCMQIPNGTDISPRIQVGLQYAGVVFEAIAEAGITRFAAVFQNADTSMIGPIRSLRTYYLDWDTPFDCTIVHAGGADDALAAVKAGNYRDLTESTTYMWRNTTNYRAPNNLFTSWANLTQFNTDNGYTTSNVKGFARMTPDAASEAAAENLRNSTEGVVVESTNSDGTTTSETVITPLVSTVQLNFGNNNNYNVIYTYDSATNTYKRAYANGNDHTSYNCGTETTTISECTREQLAPSVVIAMIVEESRASDGYHEDVTSIGTGQVYVFQNGEVIKGTWTKAAADEQIKFYDENGSEIQLGVGQTWISAIPTYGSVVY